MPTTLLIDLDEALSSFSQCQKGQKLCGCMIGLRFSSLKAPLHTKLTLMDCGIGNTNLLGTSSSGLGYDCFYMKSTDGATMYFNLGSGIGSGRIQTDY